MRTTYANTVAEQTAALVRGARAAANISQAELASRLPGWKPKRIGRIERTGDVSIAELACIARALGLPLEVLVPLRIEARRILEKP